MKATVIMAFYNAENYIHQAVDSLLFQTMTDWELIVVDDCSTDKSFEILKSFEDPRIRIIRNKTHSGPAFARNRALEIATGKYIAVLDADDVCYSERLEKQIVYLDAHTDVSILGSYAKALNEKGEYMFDLKTPLTHKEIKTKLLFENALVHSSLMFRAADLHKHNIYYNEAYYFAQDFELLARASRIMKVASLPEFLIGYRISPYSISNRYKENQIDFKCKVIESQLKNYGIEISKEQFNVIHDLMYQIELRERRQRLLFLSLIGSIFFKIRRSSSFSLSVLWYFFYKYYLLSLPNKRRSFSKIAFVFDIFFALKFSAWLHPIKSLQLIKHFYGALFDFYVLKLGFNL